MAVSSLGEVDIKLGEDTHTLRCTVRAWEEINALFGSYTEAYRQLATLNSAAYISIVAAGLGKPPKEIKSAVYAAGMSDLVGPLTKYLTLLSNGGREPVEETPGKLAPPPGEG
jgi:hypothetical protein